LTGPLESQLFDALSAAPETDNAHDIHHAVRVWKNARYIAASEGAVDDTVLICACYLHDLVSLPKNAPNRSDASRLAAEAAEPIMQKLGLTNPQVEAAKHAIIAHSFSANVPAETLEAKILQDADRIESLGAIGLARVFAVSGNLNRALFNGADPFAESRPLDDSTYAVDHFARKLLLLPQQMKTNAGKALADQRAQILRQFLQNLAIELDVPIPPWATD
jgi:uncharacterized protein